MRKDDKGDGIRRRASGGRALYPEPQLDAREEATIRYVYAQTLRFEHGSPRDSTNRNKHAMAIRQTLDFSRTKCLPTI
jgi:hypothetical protein